MKPTESKSEILDGDGSGMPGGGLSFNLAFPPRCAPTGPAPVGVRAKAKANPNPNPDPGFSAQGERK